jgi:nucleoside-diphosphate-sugar epimerase
MSSKCLLQRIGMPLAKVSAEAFLSATGHEGALRWNIIRPGPVVGAPAFTGGPHKSDRRVEQILDFALRGEDIHVQPGDARQFIGVEDLARVYFRLLESECYGQTLIALSENMTSWEWIARRVVELTGSSSRVLVQGPKLEPPWFDVSKLASELGLRFDSGQSFERHLAHLAGS